MNQELLLAVANVGIKETLERMVKEGTINMDLFKSDEGQERLAKEMLDYIAELFVDEMDSENAYIELAVCSTILHILEAESPAKMVATMVESQSIPTPAGVHASAVSVKDADKLVDQHSHVSERVPTPVPHAKIHGIKE